VWEVIDVRRCVLAAGDGAGGVGAGDAGAGGVEGGNRTLIGPFFASLVAHLN